MYDNKISFPVFPENNYIIILLIYFSQITHDTDSPSSRLKIKGVCFVTNTGHEFQVRQRSNESLATK